MQKLVLSFILLIVLGCNDSRQLKSIVIEKERSAILQRGERALLESPLTITAFLCERSSGEPNDFYSEGDYWWPDPQNPEGPYIRRDGETNPDNFVAHRHAMIRFNTLVADLTSAWLITSDEKYICHLLSHINAWFIDPDTRMNPHLLYAQAIKGISSGRGIGIIDTIHLLEVVQSLIVLENSGMLPDNVRIETKKWFMEYLTWLTTHPFGRDEMNAKNNHGTCWAMQVAQFARYTENKKLTDFCRKRFKEVLLPSQLAADGSFPLELKRTKPYGYSLFNTDAMATICHILSDDKNNLWTFQTSEGASMKQAVAWIYPYIKNKSAWPYAQDVMHWEEWPVAHPALLFAAYSDYNADYINTWLQLEHYPENEEVIRNMPVLHPLLWLNR